MRLEEKGRLLGRESEESDTAFCKTAGHSQHKEGGCIKDEFAACKVTLNASAVHPNSGGDSGSAQDFSS